MRSVVGIGTAVLVALALWAGLDFALYTAEAQTAPERVCRPLIIAGQPCGTLCRTATGWAIRGCKPLNKLVRT